MTMAKPVVGLTGGIACGKSTVAHAFAALGVPVIDADLLAREVVAPGTTGLAAIVDAFGEDVLLPDGTLDRKKVGALVFEDEEARHKLNAITHPRIAAAGAEKIAELQSHPGAFIIYEAALLVESGSYRLFDALIVVSAEPEVQLERLLTRDGLSNEEAQARIDSQLPIEKKEEVADYVIHNNDTRDSVEREVADLYQQLCKRFAAKTT